MFFSLYLADLSINVAIVTDPNGILVDGEYNYPILTSIILSCNATQTDGTPITGASYSWRDHGCYTNSHGVQDPCFYDGYATGYNFTGDNLLAQDAGNVSCSAFVNGIYYTSHLLRIRISGEQL